jgi:transcriptional regulator with XRE-family HTH domain
VKAIHNGDERDLGRIIKQRRLAIALTLCQLAASSGVSPSHLGRIERGERFPSARILARIAKPLRFGDDEIFALAGYLSPKLTVEPGAGSENDARKLDPVVAGMLAQEPLEAQRAIILILSLLKSIAKNIA